MKKQGVPETDPEFIKISGILRAIHHRSNLQKQQALQQQQQRQQLMQKQNGVSPSTATNGSAINGAMPDQSQAASTGQSNPKAADDSGSTAVAQSPSSSGYKLKQDQRVLLRAQIQAFKMLQTNLPIPSSVQQLLFANQSKTASTDGASSTTQPADKTSNRGSLAPTETDADQSHMRRYESVKSPYAVLDKTIAYPDHAVRSRRAIIPSIFPPGVDVDRLRDERENIVYNRILARKAELEKLPANLGGWDTSKSDAPTDDGNLKLKALIEYKMLNLLPKQRALRHRIAQEMVHSDNLAMTANRAHYRRMKKQSLREARITEKLEKQQRDARETREKNKQAAYLRSIIIHSNEVRETGQTARDRVRRLGRTMISTHQNIEREEQKRIERTAKQRLQALKANDEETYLKLLGQAKDTRISHLLKQTDGFLKELADSVKEQQRSNVEKYGGDAPEDDEADYSTDEDEQGETRRSRVDYYEVAHRIKEEVKQQSSNLVGGTLKEYQLKGLQWMVSLYNNNLNGILADEMGLGKTIQTISLVTYLIEKKREPGPYLVIVPLSTLTNWNNEFEKWAPSVNRIVYKGPPSARKILQQQLRMQQFQVVLTTYEFIIKDRPILSKIKWVHMIVDEGHRMKNAQSKLSSTITQYYHTRHRLILTGTPLQNNLPELWALLNFVLPNIFKSVKSFDDWFNTPFANTGDNKMELSEEEQLLVIRRLHKVLRPFLLRRLKKDVEKDLPDKQERVIKCNFSALQAKLYKQLVSHNRLVVSDSKGGKTGMRGLSNMLMQLRKVCNHPFVFEQVEDEINPGRGTNDLIWRTAGKFELLDRILPKFKATGHRVLMFFQMTQIMNIMEDFLRLRGYGYLRLDGSTKADDRSDLLREFNAEGSPYFCFLLSTRAGGLGLNLQTADTVIIYDSDWNPFQDLQAQDRAHRIGQKNEVRILRLITSNSVEEKILERANFKLDMDGKVIQAGKFDNKSTNEEREAMLKVMLEAAEAAENLEGDEQDDDDLNLIMMRSEEELGLFQKMDRERNERDKKYGPNRPLTRLLGDSELPDIYLNEDPPVVDEIEENYGRGARERTRVKYDDGLTEEQWLDAVDNDEDTIEDAIARKEAKQARRNARKDKKGRPIEIANSPAAMSRESSESPAPKKRGRKPKAAEKRKADEAMLDEEVAAPPRKRGRQAKPVETLSSEDRAAMQQIMDNVHEYLMDLTDPTEEVDEDGNTLPPRPLIDPFIDLPSKRDWPQYYSQIKNPVCMSQIANKINRKEYQSLKQFWDDIDLLCSNCRTFNEEGSILYNDANIIEVRTFSATLSNTCILTAP
jgi:ATP-dependent helicase STH1/SNF2